MKVIIFDFDGTLYNGSVFGGWEAYVKNYLLKVFKKDVVKMDAFIKKYGLKTDNYIAQDIANALIKEFGTAKSLVSHMNKNIYPLNADDFKFVDDNFFSRLKDKVNMYIVTNASKNYVFYHLKNNGVSPKMFKKVYANKYDSKTPSKKLIYEKILKREGVEPSEILVVGDNDKNDLVPAQDLNFKTMLVRKIDDLEGVFNFL